MSEYVTEYNQIGDPANSFQPGDDKQRIDLTEFYEDTDQRNINTMVEGNEAFSLGRVSRNLASRLNIAGCEGFDPFPSERNARLGAEGFFSAVVDGFKHMIESIIKYIRMAINWVVDLIKSVFGFKKSERITEELSKSRDSLEKEFSKTLNALGFPASEYNLENFIGELPPGQTRQFQLTLLKSKFTDDLSAIKGLEKSLPLFQQCVSKLVQASNKVTRTSNDLKRTIDEEYKRSYVRDRRTGGHIEAPVPESNRVYKACMDASLALDIEPISKEVTALLTALYGVSFTSEELSTGFDKVRNQLSSSIQTVAVQLNKQNVAEITENIQNLNARYLTIKDDEIDLRNVNWKKIGEIINVDEATKVKTIADNSSATTLYAVYQKTAVDVRDFCNFCFLVTQQLNIVQHQVNNLVMWHNKSLAYYTAMVLGDLKTMKEMVKKTQQGFGASIPADAHGIPKVDFIKAADAQTFMEKFGAGSQVALEHDIGGLQSCLDSFTNQIGWKP